LAFVALASCAVAVFGAGCGQTFVVPRVNRNLGDGQRIVGGVEARPFSFPWIVSMQQGGSHFCGGSLIRINDTKEQSDIVVTAAHCVYDGFQAPLTVSAGAHDLYRPTAQQQTVKGIKAIYHPQYNPDTTLNDIAVVVLAQPIKFTNQAQPICLPAKGEVTPDATVATVAGWGLTAEGGDDVSQFLNQVGVPIVNGQQCASQYASQGVQINSQAMICAGFPQGGKDSCQGDSGGPFVVQGKNGYTLQGVVSFGIGCARAGLPGVYARVANYLDWIAQQVKANSKA